MYRTLIDCTQLAAQLQGGAALVFDCRFDLADTARGARDYAAAHIPGAVYAHLDHQLSSPITPRSGRHPLPDPQRLVDWLRARGLRRGRQVFVYDDSGGTMAVRLWWLLRWLGHPQVALLDGGWQAWAGAGLAVSDRVQDHPPGDFAGVPDPDMVVGTDAVQANMTARDFILVDARTGERFRGVAEPIDPVAGHVPGARNLPLHQHLAADGRFRPAQELRGLYRDLLGDPPGGQAACMCGSGVTACHNILAMDLAGYPGARLYAGSWSEWIRDPARPVATGAEP